MRLLTEAGETVIAARSRLEDGTGVADELDLYEPAYVLNAAGVTGKGSVDWCEEHKIETIRANVLGVLNLADLCNARQIYLTNFATGCIYEYDDQHPVGIGFREDEPANFHGSFYSHTKIMVEDLLRHYGNVLTLRLRMPLSDDLDHPRNFIHKIVRYERVVNVPNSMTVLDDLLPVALEMTRRRLKGVFNFVNPGVISHNELLELYRQFIDPSFVIRNFSLEDQARVLRAGRSNNQLDTTKLVEALPDRHIPDIRESVLCLFARAAQKRADQQ